MIKTSKLRYNNFGKKLSPPVHGESRKLRFLLINIYL